MFLHSPLGLTGAHRRELENLGRIRWVLLPSRFHTNYYEDYFQAFPEASFVGAPSVLQEFKVRPRNFVPLETASEALSGQIDLIPIDGMPRVEEVVAFHRHSGSLLVADLVFNAAPAGDLYSKIMLRLAGMHGGVKASRLFRALISDRIAFSKSLRRVLELPINRVLVAHGSFVEADARTVLKDAFKAVLTTE